MARGGPRPGAGRPKGTPNKKTAELRAKVEAEGVTPLDFLLGVMRDDAEDMDRRIECAKAAAQYVHPKLSSIEANVSARVSHEDALNELE
jgi:hypothetical protein